jgi:general secretion pathway protein C
MATMLQTWTTRIITFLLWALTAASAAFWVLQGASAKVSSSGQALGAVAPNSASNSAASLSTATSPQLTAQVAMALGAKNAVTPTAASELSALQARFQLMGVLNAGGKRGVALIALDGKPAKPYRVGTSIEDDWQVLSVAARSVSIGRQGQATTAFELQLPLATGSTASVGNAGPAVSHVVPNAQSAQAAPPQVGAPSQEMPPELAGERARPKLRD